MDDIRADYANKNEQDVNLRVVDWDLVTIELLLHHTSKMSRMLALLELAERKEGNIRRIVRGSCQ